MNTYKKRKNLIVYVVALIAVALLICIGIYNMPVSRLRRQLDLGEKYLEEGNYEQAIVEYDKAIAIDPKSEEAINGLADTYIAYAQSVADTGSCEEAIMILEEGYERTGKEEVYKEIQDMIKLLSNSASYSTQDMQNVHNQCLRYSGGYNYIPDKQLKEACRKYVFLMERVQTYFPDGTYRVWGWEYLPGFYYVLGEYERCLEVRKQLYEQTGDWYYAPEETVHSREGSEYLVYDEYGRVISYHQDPDDFPDPDNTVAPISYTNQYGENGKLVQKNIETWNAGEGIGNEVLTYEYDESGRVSKVTSDESNTGAFLDILHSLYIRTYVYHEDSFTEHTYLYWEYNNGETHEQESDQDYRVDDTGFAIEIGEQYNVQIKNGME